MRNDVRAHLVTVILVSCGMAATGTVVRADSCTTAATLDGDPVVLAPVAAALQEHGVAVNVEGCVGVRARVERDGAQLTVRIDGGSESITRSVADAASAATVIESWTRSDVVAPLLEIRTPLAEPEASVPIEQRIIVLEPRGIHVFTAGETSLASDGTMWVGGSVGACVRLGPMCAAARARFAQVLLGPHPFDGAIDRHSIEVLLGADLPLSYGGVKFAPGLAGGMGSIHTTFEDEEGLHMGRETGGMRADAHITVSIPLRHKLAFDLAGSVDVIQQTEIEHTSTMKMPGDPVGFLRVGAGLRYEGL
jgi:hypothetical protein